MKINGVSSIADPDKFRVGTDLTDAFKELTLTVGGHPEKHVIAADGYSTFLGENFTSTGTHVFGSDPPNETVPQAWNDESGLLRVDFERGTDFVQIDIGDEGRGPFYYTLSAFDASGSFVAQWIASGIAYPPSYAEGIHIPHFSFDDPRIAYITIGGGDDVPAWLDHLQFGVVGSTTDDVMKATNADDHYNGLAGNDRIEGLAGDDTLIGGAGSDTIIGGVGADHIDLAKGGSAGIDKVVLASTAESGDTVTGFEVTGTDHDVVDFSGSFNKAHQQSDLDDAVNDSKLQFVEGSNGIPDDSGVTVDLSNATSSTPDDRVEAVIFSQPSEGTGSTVPYDDSSALAFYAKEFSDELKLYADPGDDLLIVSNGEFGTSPDQFAAFLYVEGKGAGANGIDQEISANELTLLATFETDGNVTPDHFILG